MCDIIVLKAVRLPGYNFPHLTIIFTLLKSTICIHIINHYILNHNAIYLNAHTAMLYYLSSQYMLGIVKQSILPVVQQH